MNRPDENDELIRRYQEASAQDPRRPSAHVREAVRVHADMVSAAKVAGPARSPAPAANQSRWKVSLLASIALAGLTGLLVLQFDRATPDEQETALGRPAPAVIPPQAASPPPAVADGKVARSEAPAARSAAPAPAPRRAERPAPEAAAPPPAPPPAPTPPTAQQEAAATPERPAEAARDQASEKALAPAAPQAMARSAAAPALRAPAPAPAAQQERLAAPAPRSAAALAEALHQAARAGQLAEAEALLQQGANLNAPDSAGRTALVLAVIHGHSALVRRLLALGANPALVDRDGLDALQHARRLGRDDMVRLIEARS
jgi:hypothetical protein